MIYYIYRGKSYCIKLSDKQYKSAINMITKCSDFILENYPSTIPNPDKEYVFYNLSNDTALELFEYGMKMFANNITLDVMNRCIGDCIIRIDKLINQSEQSLLDMDVSFSCFIAKLLLHYVYTKDMASYHYLMLQLYPCSDNFDRYIHNFFLLNLGDDL